MKSHDPKDPLSHLLSRWRPENPHSTEKFVADTLRRLRLEKPEPGARVLDWLPAPRRLMPLTAAAVLLVALLQWHRAEREAAHMAARVWQAEAADPASPVSLTGTYREMESRR